MPELPITLSVLVMPIAPWRAIGATLALAIGITCLLRGRRAIWQTTLKSAWGWSLAALVAWGAVELAAAVWPASGNGKWAAIRFMAITLSLCPVIALMGAKRPQETAWNFVVLALWGVLVMPALETQLLRPGQNLTLGVFRGGFLAVPLVLVSLNYGGTRYRFAAALTALSQLLALSIYWLPAAPRSEDIRGLLGLLSLATALAIALYSAARRPSDRLADQLWTDFRDTLGAFWALRVAERLNATALQHDWPVELTWSGMRSRDQHEVNAFREPNMPAPAANTLRGLLRRFVTNDWIDQRLSRKASLVETSNQTDASRRDASPNSSANGET